MNETIKMIVAFFNLIYKKGLVGLTRGMRKKTWSHAERDHASDNVNPISILNTSPWTTNSGNKGRRIVKMSTNYLIVIRFASTLTSIN